MAGVFRFGLARVIAVAGHKPVTVKKLLPEVQFVRCISGKALKIVDPDVKKPAPYPYQEKSYTLLNRFLDCRTTDRFDENSKVIVIDGPIAAGKSFFAKTLANDLDMLYYPEANLDMVYINDYGYDLRQLDHLVSEQCRSFDIKDFLKNPNHRLAASMQIIMYTVRYSQYIDALAHVLSTGQGVVLDRSVYSDFVFLEAMVSQGYVSKAARSVYYDVKKNTISELMKPHLVIYLDIPVECVQQRIKDRNIPYEVKSSVLNTEYLTAMENVYKQQYLKEISKHAELLVYDWSQGGDVEVVIEDIERIDFERFDAHDSKMHDWRLDDEEAWAVQRKLYADQKHSLLCYLNVPRFDVPELVTGAEELKHYRDVMETAPGGRYETGYNVEAGDSVLLKMKRKQRDTLPMIERIIKCN